MKSALFSSLLVLLSLMGINSAAVASTDEERKMCESFAEEEKITAEEMESYMADCIASLKAEAQEPEEKSD